MKIKNIQTYDMILEYTFNNLNEISNVVNQIIIESNEKIINELYNDLLHYIKESSNNMKNRLSENQLSFVQRNTNDIAKMTFTINRNSDKNIIINELNKLYESFNCNIKDYYFDNEYDDEVINKIFENYISNFINIINVNNELYRKEILCLEGAINLDYSKVYNNIVHGLMESNEGKISNFISNIKTNFGNKHDKIIARDKQWLSSNKKGLINKDYTGTQIEVVNDYKITFEMLLNRHYTFDKVFTNNPDNLDEGLRRFEDKRGDLKNGLDNYYRTGSSKREVGLKKLSDEEIQPVIKLLVAYCENFLAGRKYIEEKMDNIIQDLNQNEDNIEQPEKKEEIKETSSFIFRNTFNPYKLTTLLEAEKEDDFDEEAYEDELNQTEFEDDDDKEKDDVKEEKENNRSMRDRQVGIAVLLNVAEERYFDYINILKGLMEE